MKKKNLFYIIILLLLLVLITLLVIFMNNYKYRVEYEDGNYQYDIKVYNNRVSVEVLEQAICVTEPCDSTFSDYYILSFDEEEMDIVYQFMDELFDEEDEKVKKINLEELNDRQVKILNSIIKNDSSYLDILDEDEVNKELLFSIYSARLNCITVRLEVYKDNTYQFGTQTGRYTYDVNKIFDNIDKYEENNYGPYIMIDENSNEYYLYNNNNELNGFLQSIDVSLDTCIALGEGN